MELKVNKIKKFKFNYIKIKKIKAIIYGKNFKNIQIEITDNNYYEYIKKNTLINLKLNNKNYKTIIKNIKYHPYKKSILHIDFFINV